MVGMIRRFDTRRQTAAEILSAVRRPPLLEMEPPARAVATLERLFGPGTTPLDAVRRIVESVRREGDRAVIRWTRELDGISLSPGELWIGPERLESAAGDPALAALVPALRAAAGAVERFHRRQLPSPVFEVTAPGVAVGWYPGPVRRA
ncbi:MAG: histidinol dehydrogenase, partial [Bacillota bacterium]